MELGVRGWEIIFNIIYFGFAFGFGAFVLCMYKVKKPVYYGYLIWASVLILFSALLFVLYSGSLEILSEHQSSMLEADKVKNNIIGNLKILVFIVPGVMLAVAANLITEYLKSDKPRL